MSAGLSFKDALAALRKPGVTYTICGLSLTVNGLTMAITKEQFDRAWDVLDEIEGEDFQVDM